MSAKVVFKPSYFVTDMGLCHLFLLPLLGKLWNCTLRLVTLPSSQNLLIRKISAALSASTRPKTRITWSITLSCIVVGYSCLTGFSVPTHWYADLQRLVYLFLLFSEERVVPIEVSRPKLSRYLQGIVFRCHKCTFTSGTAENLCLHMMRHNDIKPYKCRLCYFDCTQLSDLEAHLSDKHQVSSESITYSHIYQRLPGTMEPQETELPTKGCYHNYKNYEN